MERAAPETASRSDLLSAIDRLVPKRIFESDALTVVADLRWYVEIVAEEPGGPLVLLRRWPGDTVLALYALDPRFTDGHSPLLPVEGSSHRRIGASNRIEWRGSLPTEFGDRPWLWTVRSVGYGLPRLGVLVLPGDAGFGAEAIPALEDEARVLAERVEIRRETWWFVRSVEPGQSLVIPRSHAVPGNTSERSAPWQVVHARSFTIGLPPGIRTMRLDLGVHAADDLPGGLLWLRGRFHDIEGTRVVVGDGSRFGYVARLEASPKAWRKGKQAPLGVPGATRASASVFPLAAQRIGARSVTAERWTEEGFDGDWLVFRLAFKKEGYEIGLPVSEGWQSRSLFWIALTFRGAGYLPAPPPLDSADRFGIRFIPTEGPVLNAQGVPEGTLEVPGLRLRIPDGVLPRLTSYSEDGYPISFVALDGAVIGTLCFVDRTAVAALIASLPVLSESKETFRHHADRVLGNEDGSRLFVTMAGDVYHFQPGSDSATSHEEDGGAAFLSDQLWERIIKSVRLLGDGRSDDDAP